MEEKEYKIEDVIAVAANEKYAPVFRVGEKTLTRAKGIGKKTVKLENVVEEEVIPTKHNTEQSVEDKIKLRQRSINTLHNEIARLDQLTSNPLNKHKMLRKGEVLENLVKSGIVDAKEKMYISSKDIAARYVLRVEEQELVEEIEEILGDPIKEVETPKEEIPQEDMPKEEVEIPEEEVEIPEEEVEIPEEETPKEEGKK